MSTENQIVILQHSDDGGHTWGAEIFKPIGVETDYLRRIEQHQCGASLQRTVRIVFTEDADFTLIEGMADVSVEI